MHREWSVSKLSLQGCQAKADLLETMFLSTNRAVFQDNSFRFVCSYPISPLPCSGHSALVPGAGFRQAEKRLQRGPALETVVLAAFLLRCLWDLCNSLQQGDWYFWILQHTINPGAVFLILSL